MSKYKLTVAIPTYNRPKQLKETLDVILPQVLSHDDTQLIILDNCSATPALDVLMQAACGKSLPGRIKTIRHVANIGGDWNALRSFEVAEGEWLWCLGDDDNPANDALETILADIENADHCYGFYRVFKDSDCPNVSDCRGGRYIGNSIDEWVRRVPSYGARLFLSASVYKLSAVRPYLINGYLVSASGSPHLTMAMFAILAGGKYLLSQKSIANYQPPQSVHIPNRAALGYGSVALLMMVGGLMKYEYFRKFYENCFCEWVSPYRLLADVILLHGEVPRSRIRRWFGIIAALFKPALFDNPRSWAKWSICQFFACMPGMFMRLLSIRYGAKFNTERSWA